MNFSMIFTSMWAIKILIISQHNLDLLIDYHFKNSVITFWRRRKSKDLLMFPQCAQAVIS